jgi:heme-degrading monooxygenase HmoA
VLEAFHWMRDLLASGEAIADVQVAVESEGRDSEPAGCRKGDYLEHAARLRSELECMDGFISVERFQSLTDPDKLLSLSFWRDEEADAGWRSRAGHRAAQSAGRKGVFRDYRPRVVRSGGRRNILKLTRPERSRLVTGNEICMS